MALPGSAVQQFPGDDQFADFHGAAADFIEFDGAVKTVDCGLAHIAHAAKDLNGLGHDVRAGPRRVGEGGRGLGMNLAAAILYEIYAFRLGLMPVVIMNGIFSVLVLISMVLKVHYDRVNRASAALDQ